MLIPALTMALASQSPQQMPANPPVSIQLPAPEAPANAPPPEGAPAADQTPSPAAPAGQAAEETSAAPPAASAVPAAPPTSATPTAPAAEGQIVVTGEAGPPPGDPAQVINQQSYEAVQAVDDAVVAPVAMTYKHALPSPVRSGLRNFLSNLMEPVVFVNYLLQLKPGKAAETAGRFALNSTLGVAGLVDVAKTKPFHLPRRVNGFANTFGYYGIGPGPYLFLPLVGPTTIRDLIGLGLDRAVLPFAVGKPFNRGEWVLGAGTIKSLDDRVEFGCELARQRESSNPYNTAREYYLERRKAEIEALHGRSYQPVGHSLMEITEQCAKTSAQVKPAPETP